MAEARGAAVIRLRPVRREDHGLVRTWLQRPDIEAWWGPASATGAEVTIALTSPSAICCIIEADGEPVGYCHAIDAQTWGDALPEELEPGTWDLDIFIASERHRGQGVGPTALSLLKDEVFSTTFAVAVCVFAPVRNEAAVRAYERAGFRWRRIWTDAATGPAWFMVAMRPQRI